MIKERQKEVLMRKVVIESKYQTLTAFMRLLYRVRCPILVG